MILFINTAIHKTFVGLAENGRLIKSIIWEAGFNQSEELLPNIEKLVGDKKIEGIVVVNGPGSFTGLRVGVACANALGFGWGVGVVGVDRFDPMISIIDEKKNICCVLDNIHDLVYAKIGNEYFVGNIDELCLKIKEPYNFVGEINGDEEKLIRARLGGNARRIEVRNDFDKDVLENLVKIGFERLYETRKRIVVPVYIKSANITKPKNS